MKHTGTLSDRPNDRHVPLSRFGRQSSAGPFPRSIATRKTTRRFDRRSNPPLCLLFESPASRRGTRRATSRMRRTMSVLPPFLFLFCNLDLYSPTLNVTYSRLHFVLLSIAVSPPKPRSELTRASQPTKADVVGRPALLREFVIITKALGYCRANLK